MKHIGPLLETLTHRLADTPPDFLDEPRIGKHGSVFVPAVVNDLLAMHGVHGEYVALQRFASDDIQADRNYLGLVQIACWLLADEWFIAAACSANSLWDWLQHELTKLAAITPAHRFVHDAERREEMARLSLFWLGYRPQGETEAQATDRLSRVSGRERQRLLATSRSNEQRARKIREALAKKAADEAADKWTRE